MLNEDLIEMAFIDQLTDQGFSFNHGPDIAPDSDNPQRKNFDSVVLENELLKVDWKRKNNGNILLLLKAGLHEEFFNQIKKSDADFLI